MIPDTRYFNRTEPTVGWYLYDGVWFKRWWVASFGRYHAEPIEDEV